MGSIKNIGLACLLLFPAINVCGQERDFEKEFNEFKGQQEQEFEDFNEKINKEFADFLRLAWDEFAAEKPTERVERPEPVEPVKYDVPKKDVPQVEILPAGITSYIPQPKQSPLVPVKVPEKDFTDRISIPFYGTEVKVAATFAASLSLPGIEEKDVASAWTKLCKGNYQLLLQDCMNIRNELQLNDWAYRVLAEKIALKLFDEHQVNEIAFLQMFILTQSGYKVKIAKIGEQLTLIMATASTIYGKPSITINGDRYYIYEPLGDRASKGVFTYRNEFANAKNLIDLHVQKPLNLEIETYERKYSPKNGSFSVASEVNMNLIDFYADYPQCDIDIYAKAPMSKELTASVFPAFKQAIAGKTKKEAVAVLLDFIQTSFEYQTDRDQFGYEKPFFLDELFFYPYNDCEDRAVLFSFLVKELVGLDAVLLDYPKHIAAAVCLDEEVNGDYLLIDNKKYIICDPTFIGAPIGACMPEYRNTSPKVLR